MNSRTKQKLRTRRAIVRSAARLARRRGIAGMGIADAMADAGLTVGGFYAHFASKRALADETIHFAMGERLAKLLARPYESDWRDRLEREITDYLSVGHRDDPANGCPLPAIVGDVASDGIGRDALAGELGAMEKAFREGRNAQDPRAPRAAALGSMALMLGGLLLARAVHGRPLSDEILTASRSFGRAAVRQIAEAE